jgi:hypothetical protein
MMRESDESFEYDSEDAEANDETFEASDEADGEADEADEAFEASDEADGEADEAFEASDEADEASDEADEGTDEAYMGGWFARSKAAEELNRQATWRAKIASDQRGEAQRAAALQRDIASRIRAIRPGGAGGAGQSVGRLRAGGAVLAQLPNGRTTRINFSPELAPLREVNRLRVAFNYNDRRRAAAIASNSRAISGLKAAQTATVAKLTRQQVQSDKDLGKRLVELDAKINKRISSEVANNKTGLDRYVKRTRRLVRRNRMRGLLNSALMVSALPQFVAYSKKDLFHRDNLILAGSLAGWMFGDEVIDQFTGNAKTSKTWSGLANAWSWAAPVGNFATVQLLLKDRQHERFITGISRITADASSATVKIGVAKDSVDDFKALKGAVPVVTTFVSDGRAVPADDIQASVVDDTVVFKLKTSPTGSESVTVAWIVDSEPATV